MISPTDVIQAETRIRPFIVKTSLDPSFRLSDLAGCDIWLKLEQTQYTGSFKLRGAANKVLSLTPEELERGVITASNGNHGIAAHGPIEDEPGERERGFEGQCGCGLDRKSVV